MNGEFRKVLNGISVAGEDQGLKIKQVDSLQGKYDRDFAVAARNFEEELLRRIPDAEEPKDSPSAIASMLIKGGRLAGADPADMIASYIETLTAKLQVSLK